ncbi:helix-turn-helix domain-containing protein [Streptomyces hirsutus]|uniref:Helix-turn-helix domain-containing protein n=1 Tax=Streptomyces hirsutus TaxID=35620 RepID=A0ABZ1GTG8_9ACTN|nr:helix-turn-helix domain-containing protein [Streptomyces hirsutus]WSD08936.1 helix-turn-helix domain-containing protein [Streptomyces hirsutus]WTD17611.1 helix-turn-helix domain-containing protein [Streptomyces hirsutus]
MNDFSAEAMGFVIREHRQAQRPSMTQEELAKRAEYGKGGAVSISRIESGLISPGEHRLAAIALALQLTPEQLKQEAEDRTRSLTRQRGQQSVKLRDQVAETKRRHAEINEKVAQRSKITQERGEAFNRVHDAARDGFFLRFVELAESISGAPEPERPSEEEIESTGEIPTAIRIEAMSAGIANAIRGAAAGGAAGVAVGGAAAYGAFTAAALFGTASTGTAISTLSGVAATNATLAVLGGGTLAAGGAGMAGGTLLLTGMVAAPAAALAAAGFYVLRQRRNKKEEERLRTEVEAAEAALDQSQQGFDTMIDVLHRAPDIMEYVSVHGTHALEKWRVSLPPEPRDWESLGHEGQEQYKEFLTVAGCLLAVSTINVSALLTAKPDALPEMDKAIDETLRYADKTIKSIV